MGLIRQKKKVTILEESERIADTPYFIHSGRRSELHRFLVEEDLMVFTSAKVKTITDDEVVFEAKEPKLVNDKPAWMTAGSYVVEKVEIDDDTEVALERSVPADTVIVAVGRHPNRTLADALTGKAFEV